MITHVNWQILKNNPEGPGRTAVWGTDHGATTPLVWIWLGSFHAWPAPHSLSPCSPSLSAVKLSNKGKISQKKTTFLHLHGSEMPWDHCQSLFYAGLCHQCSAERFKRFKYIPKRPRTQQATITNNMLAEFTKHTNVNAHPSQSRRCYNFQPSIKVMIEHVLWKLVVVTELRIIWTHQKLDCSTIITHQPAELMRIRGHQTKFHPSWFWLDQSQLGWDLYHD